MLTSAYDLLLLLLNRQYVLPGLSLAVFAIVGAAWTHVFSDAALGRPDTSS